MTKDLKVSLLRFIHQQEYNGVLGEMIPTEIKEKMDSGCLKAIRSMRYKGLSLNSWFLHTNWCFLAKTVAWHNEWFLKSLASSGSLCYYNVRLKLETTPPESPRPCQLQHFYVHGTRIPLDTHILWTISSKPPMNTIYIASWLKYKNSNRTARRTANFDISIANSEPFDCFYTNNITLLKTLAPF